MVKTPEEAKRKWEENLAAKASVIYERATSPGASSRYRKGIADFLGIPESEVADEDEKRKRGLEAIKDPAVFLKRIEKKGDKWFEGMKQGFLAKRVA